MCVLSKMLSAREAKFYKRRDEDFYLFEVLAEHPRKANDPVGGSK